jgi:serine/threonine-protein phosphatase 5
MKKINKLKDEASKILKSPNLDNQKLEEALNKYTEAIDLKIKDKINSILFSNRAWVNLKLERNGAALEDANKAIKWDPNNIKGYYRRGCANLTLCKYEEALIDLEYVYTHYPKENPLIEKIKEIKFQLEKKNKNKKINNSLNNNSLEASPEELLDIKYIQEEIKREENRLKRGALNHEKETDYRNDTSDTETSKKPEYKGKLSLTKEWIVEKVIEGMKNKNFMSKLSLLRIILDVIQINMNEPSLIDIEVKANKNFNICGDIHGQFYDLLKIFDVCGYPSETNPYLFNGDFVDRGSFSVECIITLLCFKLLYPKHFYLARGNHESRNLNKVYGFEQEVISKYDSTVYESFIRLFYSLSLAHCINHEILIVHGGLFSKDGVTLEDIRKIKRFREVPESGIMCELLWSDPSKINGRHPSNRGIAITFGPDVVKNFLKSNKLQKLVRSHECKSEGYEILGDVITVFSAPNYCDNMGNKGAVIQLKGNHINIKQFTCAWHPQVESFAILNNWIFS